MIFVIVGTHEQPFNRLLQKIDELIESNEITEEVFIQTGYSTYKPKFFQWSKLLPYQEMVKKVDEARVVITHGGPSSFIMPLQIGKPPIVIPRQKKYGEHVNDHQVHFVKEVSERMGNIIMVVEVDKLGEVIKDYDSIVNGLTCQEKSNNTKFCNEFEKIVDELFKEKKR